MLFLFSSFSYLRISTHLVSILLELWYSVCFLYFLADAAQMGGIKNNKMGNALDDSSASWEDGPRNKKNL